MTRINEAAGTPLPPKEKSVSLSSLSHIVALISAGLFFFGFLGTVLLRGWGAALDFGQMGMLTVLGILVAPLALLCSTVALFRKIPPKGRAVVAAALSGYILLFPFLAIISSILLLVGAVVVVIAVLWSSQATEGEPQQDPSVTDNSSVVARYREKWDHEETSVIALRYRSRECCAEESEAMRQILIQRNAEEPRSDFAPPNAP